MSRGVATIEATEAVALASAKIFSWLVNEVLYQLDVLFAQFHSKIKIL